MGAWEQWDDRPLLGSTYGPTRVRTFVFGLRDGGLCAVSPGGRDEQRFAELEAHGPVRFLLAPNHFHNLGLASWKARFPDARVVAHPLALPRLRKRVPELGFEDLTALEAALPEGVRLFSPPATQGETWVSAKTADGSTWFVTDGILNETELPRGVMGWGMWAMGFRTGLLTNPMFKRLFVRKAEYQEWVRQQLALDPPTRFVPCHGAVLTGPDVAAALREVTDRA
ncbi:MAG: hypothetical protein ABMA64_01605 [Myxococcota bacterium]